MHETPFNCTRPCYGFNCRAARGSLRKAHFIGLGRTLLIVEFVCLQLEFFAYSWSLLTYSGRMCLISTYRDCKQRSSTVSKNAPTVSKRASPLLYSLGEPPLHKEVVVWYFNWKIIRAFLSVCPPPTKILRKELAQNNFVSFWGAATAKSYNCQDIYSPSII